MLAWRVTISAILIPLLVLIFYLDARAGESSPWLLVLVTLLGLRAVWELTELLRPRIPQLNFPLMCLCVIAIMVGSWWPHLRPDPPELLDLTPLALALCFSVMLLCAVEARRFQAPGHSWENLGTETFIVCYIGLLLAMTAQLRWVAGEQAGYLVIGSLVLCTKGADVGAYFAGKRFGKRKLAPVLSPGKTWEGVVGAVLGAALCGWLWLTFAPGWFVPDAKACPWYYALLYGGVISLAGMVGDLCESLLKRDVGRKDSAALLPGFGGLLDLLDSVLYAGPVALLLWKVLPLATWM
ncbi:phosphatidate cytidylyltransferase [Planctomicrobium piriforme]|uniref:Phosphatidate cytidylyltransferase n=1 Tax=Planctomicrobium piriforme TaxID=1576369 RepID=A0A1I3M3K1_9PLAN|nr:phosphatidate cytidylyltransferase [Planctomicrobium piriforme]SFI91370.1 phosphatidate cytidylyltransferase [Planctomicrobium piriforme]